MSKVLLDLEDFVITDIGEVLFKHDAVVDLIRRGQSTDNVLALDHDDIRFSNKRRPDKKIKISNISGKAESIDDHCYDFILPEFYKNLDLSEYLAETLIARELLSDVYVKRVELELDMMEARGMGDFIRALIYIVNIFEENGVVHGVGRGSACASLVLYLIGIHLVDPIEHQIEITEFLR